MLSLVVGHYLNLVLMFDPRANTEQNHGLKNNALVVAGVASRAQGAAGLCFCGCVQRGLLGDLFPVSQRSAMAALVQIAVGAGIGGGQVGNCSPSSV
jgi:hypothetical protein